MKNILDLLQPLLDYPFYTIVVSFCIIKYKVVLEVLSSYDKDQNRMVLSSRKAIAFMSAQCLFHQITYCLKHDKVYNIYASWTLVCMTLVLLGLVSIPEVMSLIGSLRGVPPDKNVTVTTETKTEIGQ